MGPVGGDYRRLEVEVGAGSNPLLNDISADEDAWYLRSPGVLPVINTIDLGPHVEVDVTAMVKDTTAARHGRSVLALSRHQQDTVETLCAWIRWLNEEHVSGRHAPQDPGPMAPHAH